MRYLVITSSYPTESDKQSIGGLFALGFAKELAAQGHSVVVQPVKRLQPYRKVQDVIVSPSPWLGGNRTLADMNLFNPMNWIIFLHYIIFGCLATRRACQQYKIDRILCMWIVPSGIFGWWGRKSCREGYDVWALGSDIWKIGKIPLLGKRIIRLITQGCRRAFADGLKLCRDVTEISGVACEFMPTSRRLPIASDLQPLTPSNKRHLLFVGRYHVNKGPDLLVDALALLDVEELNGIMVHMFGVGPMEEELRSKIISLGLDKTISLNGIIQPQQFANILARIDYELIPSRIESIPVVFSDAIQCGVPVIAMPVGDLRELITEYECGIVAEEISAKSFCDALQKGLAIKKSKFQDGVARATTKFNVINTVRQWQKS